MIAAALLLVDTHPVLAESPDGWQVACYGEGATRNCEATQAVFVGGTPTPLARAALGWLGVEAPLMLTVMVAPDVSLSSPLDLAIEGQGNLALPWTRCRPSGCFATMNVTEEDLRTLLGGERRGHARLSFTDGEEAMMLLNLPLAGITEAIEVLEDSRRD